MSEPFVSIIIIVVAAITTFLTRVIPFLFFGGEKKTPAIITYLGAVLPPAIMGTLVIYCLKSAQLTQYPHALPELIAIAVVAISYKIKKNSLISIGLGTLVYMILVQNIFI